MKERHASCAIRRQLSVEEDAAVGSCAEKPWLPRVELTVHDTKTRLCLFVTFEDLERIARVRMRKREREREIGSDLSLFLRFGAGAASQGLVSVHTLTGTISGFWRRSL